MASRPEQQEDSNYHTHSPRSLRPEEYRPPIVTRPEIHYIKRRYVRKPHFEGKR